MRSIQRRRQGAVLLVVLSLLVLFVVAGLSFTVLTGSFRRSTQHLRKLERTGDPPQQLLDGAMLQLLRGPGREERSVLRGHDLLNDLYGNDGATIRCKTVAIYQPQPTEPEFPGFVKLTTAPMRTVQQFTAGQFNGSILTFLGDHDFHGISARIVDFDIETNASNQEYIVIIAELPESIPHTRVGELNDHDVLLNGRPFNGTGAGYNATTGALDASTTVQGIATQLPLALLPNAQASPSSNWEEGGMNESYDAPDFQNMFLAWQPPSVANSGQIIPSFHRPALLNYWNAQHDLASNPDLLRAVLMRPNWIDHPNFTGSNANLATDQVARLIQGAYIDPNDPNGNVLNVWDVDNNMDGVPDSIWVDLGFPVQTTTDGRNYKPLFAILCVDLDSRVNINVHGSKRQRDADYGLVNGNFDISTIAGFNVAPADLNIGQGFGPADINVSAALPDPTEPTQLAVIDAIVLDRYRSQDELDNEPGKMALDDDVTKWSKFSTQGNYTFRGSWKLPGLTPDWSSIPDPSQLGGHGVGAYGSPPDMLGITSVLLNHAGQPVFARTAMPNVSGGGSYPDQVEDDPYEVNVNSRQGSDHMFGDADLEAVLRKHEYDGLMLDSRLRGLLNQLDMSITTRSFDIPTPNGFVDWFMHPGTGERIRSKNMLTAIRAVLLANGVSESSVRDEIMTMLPFEVRRGERFNLNRPVGLGIDMNNNGVVDEPWWGVGSGDMPLTDTVDVDWSSNPLKFDLLNNQPTGAGQPQAPAQQLFARHLYCLFMFLKQPDVVIDFDGVAPANPPSQEDYLETARGIAQWCVNVIDFRDSDSIMTPFEFDFYPYDGWDVDGDLMTNENDPLPPGSPPVRGVVWGCERPELLITETLATHDRRTEDTDQEGFIEPNGNDPEVDAERGMSNAGGGEDRNYDQRLRPIGSLFVELYNPWIGHTTAPAELLYDPYNPALGVDLQKWTPASNAGLPQSPVWRLVVADSTTSPRNPAPAEVGRTGWDPDLPPAPVRFERFIYFAIANNPNNPIQNPLIAPLEPRQARHFPSINVPAPRTVVAGQYAVIGPHGFNVAGDYITPIGRVSRPAPHSTWDGMHDETRRIVLRPGSSPSRPEGVFFTNQGGPHDLSFPPVAQRPAVVVIDQAEATDAAGIIGPVKSQMLSVSEPLSGYPDLDDHPACGWDATAANGEGAYAVIFDCPFDDPGNNFLLQAVDQDHIDDDGVLRDRVRTLGTHPNFRAIHLQRLANPLLPWHPATNPYLTIDSSSIDLHVFNGLYPQTLPNANSATTAKDDYTSTDGDDDRMNDTEWYGVRVVPDPSDPTNNDKGLWWFRSQERGEREELALTEPGIISNPNIGDVENDHDDRTFRTLWRQETPRTTSDLAMVSEVETAPAENHNMNFWLHHTLGYASNDWLSTGDPGIDPVTTMLPGGFPNTSGRDPFPWLVWNNRPFANAMELLHVPFTSSSQLLRKFDYLHRDNPNALGVIEPYNPFSPSLPSSARSTFGHLLNFFDDTDDGAAPIKTNPQLSRLFDYVEAPSLFEGTYKWYSQGTFEFQPPFNRLSQFRRPGMVNLNTISDSRVWDALMYGNPAAPTFEEIDQSRRGYGTVGPTTLDASIPTVFANPFRSPTSSRLVPLNAMNVNPIQAGLMRRQLDASGTGYLDSMLFEPDRTGAVQPFSRPFDNADRNSFFRYYTLQRLGSVATTHSNCFAVWITVGYFEVTPWTDANGRLAFDTGHPDGWQLGQEVGFDNGTTQRHRAFYIIDRSIPVGYETGMDHNVRDAVVLQRIIE